MARSDLRQGNATQGGTLASKQALCNTCAVWTTGGAGRKTARNFTENTRCRACCCFATCCKCTASALCGPSSQATFCWVNVVNTSVLLIKMILHFCMCPAVLEGSTLGISPQHSGCMPSLATTTAPWWLVANIVAIGGVAVQPNPPP